MASGSSNSGFSIIVSSVSCCVPPALLCWCCALPVDCARIAARVGNSACSVSGPLGGAYVVMVCGAAVTPVAPGTVPQPCTPSAACASECCGMCGRSCRRVGAVVAIVLKSGPPPCLRMVSPRGLAEMD